MEKVIAFICLATVGTIGGIGIGAASTIDRQEFSRNVKACTYIKTAPAIAQAALIHMSKKIASNEKIDVDAAVMTELKTDMYVNMAYCSWKIGVYALFNPGEFKP